jgi:hypothetical protein
MNLNKTKHIQANRLGENTTSITNIINKVNKNLDTFSTDQKSLDHTRPPFPFSVLHAIYKLCARNLINHDN